MKIKSVAVLGAGAVGSYVIWGLSQKPEVRLGVIADRAIRRSGRLRNPMSRTTCSPGRTKSAHATTRNRRRAHNNPAIPEGHARSTPSRATARTPGRFHWPADWPPHVRSSSHSLPSCVFVFCVRHRLQSGRRITFQCHVPSPMVVARAPAVTPSRIRPPHSISSSHPAKVPSQGRHMGLSPDEGSRRGTDIRS